MYSKFCRQVSYELIVSLSVSGHCFGALCDDDMDDMAWTLMIVCTSIYITVCLDP